MILSTSSSINTSLSNSCISSPYNRKKVVRCSKCKKVIARHWEHVQEIYTHDTPIQIEEITIFCNICHQIEKLRE